MPKFDFALNNGVCHLLRAKYAATKSKVANERPRFRETHHPSDCCQIYGVPAMNRLLWQFLGETFASKSIDNQFAAPSRAIAAVISDRSGGTQFAKCRKVVRVGVHRAGSVNQYDPARLL